jgi:transposase
MEELYNKESFIKAANERIKEISQSSEVVSRIMEIPGIGLVIATAILGQVGDFNIFRSGREFAAWLGLVPKQHTSADKVRLGRITKAGNQYLRRLLVQGAKAVGMIGAISDRISIKARENMITHLKAEYMTESLFNIKKTLAFFVRSIHDVKKDAGMRQKRC